MRRYIVAGPTELDRGDSGPSDSWRIEWKLTDPSHIYYLNSDFDLSLGPHQFINSGLVRQVRELSVQALIGAEKSDAAWVRADVPPDFTSYLAENGLPVPQLLQHPQIDPARRLRPFGWNHEAIELNLRHSRPAAHPPLSVVGRVNSRSFACDLEAELFPDDPRGTLVESVAELETFLACASAKSEWVVKAEHGNAGLGNRRLSNAHLSAAVLRFVNVLLAEDKRLVIEPWLKRTCDRSMVFDVPFDVAGLRIHEIACTDGGALVGAIFDPELQADVWWHAMADAAERIAERLGDEGYFGPVSVDAFHWRDGNRMRLRSLVDLNARCAMSDGAYRLWQQVVPERTLFYRFFNRRKLTALPKELAEVVDALGRRRYDPSRRRGILLASPMRLGLDGETRKPGKLAVIFIAETRSEIFALERWFRDQFEV